MRRTCLKNGFIGYVLILFLALPATVFAETTFNQIIIFGDSISDPGNAFLILGEQSTPPYDTLGPLLFPSAPYAKGGHHFSNGDTWVEQFARIAGLAGDANPAFLGAGTNYAVGGATARDDGISFNLPAQIDMFLDDFDGDVPEDALYILEFGAKDIIDAIYEYIDGDDDYGDAIVAEAIASIIGSIETLYGLGARQFLICNAPNTGLTPMAVIMDTSVPGISELATWFSFQFIVLLAANLPSSLDEIKIVNFDFFGLQTDLVVNYTDYGFEHAADSACIQPDSPPFQCKEPDTYLFWDGVHPTKAAHAFFAEEAVQALAEP